LSLRLEADPGQLAALAFRMTRLVIEDAGIRQFFAVTIR